MPRHWFYLLLLVPAIPLVQEDFRTRRIAVTWLALLGLAVVLVNWNAVGPRSMLLRMIINTGILLSCCGATALWHLLRRRALRSFFSNSLGEGDIVMMFALTALFAPFIYVRFLIASCLAALIWWYIKRPQTIPFAGIMALTLAVYALCRTIGLWN